MRLASSLFACLIFISVAYAEVSYSIDENDTDVNKVMPEEALTEKTETDVQHGDHLMVDMDDQNKPMDHAGMDHENMGDNDGIQNEAAEEIEQFSNEEALEVSQSVFGQTVGLYNFQLPDGSKINSKEFLGKPVIVSLIYTSCYHICPTITENLNRVVKKARDALGKDSFNVLTIGFDTKRDTPEAMATFSEAHSSGADNWFFLSTDDASMQALSRDLGFIYTPSAAGFNHLIQVTILDEQGKVYRQVYGLQPKTPNFIEPIKELVFGESTEHSLFQGLTAKINLFCTFYDPVQDRYRYDYTIFVGLIVGTMLGIIFLTLLIREWRYTGSSKT